MASMIRTDVETNGLRQHLIHTYQQLSPLDQQILQLFAVIYEPIGRSTVLKCLHHAQIHDASNHKFTSSVLKRHLDDLENTGLLLPEARQGLQCHPLLVESVTRDAHQSGHFERYAQAVEQTIPIRARWSGGPLWFRSEQQLMRTARIGIYREDLACVKQRLTDYQQYTYDRADLSLSELLKRVFNSPFDPDWMRTLSPAFYERVMATLLEDSIQTLTDAEALFVLLEEGCTDAGPYCSDPLRVMLAEQLLLRGQVEEVPPVLAALGPQSQAGAAILQGWLWFLQGEDAKAITTYTTGLNLLRKAKGKDKTYFQRIGGLFFVLALLQAGNLQDAAAYCSLIVKQPQHGLKVTYGRLHNLIQVQQGDLSGKEVLLGTFLAPQVEHHSLGLLIRALCLYWVDRDAARARLPQVLEPFYQQAVRAGYHWLAMEAAELLARLNPKSSYGVQSEILREGSGIVPLVEVMQLQEPWELCLQALAALNRPQAASSSPVANRRLVWWITLYGSSWQLHPREQKMSVKGGWSRGRPLSLKRLSEDIGDFDYLTPQDLQICAQIETTYTSGYRYYGKVEYGLTDKAITALIGHPLVFWEDTPHGPRGNRPG